MLVSKSVAANGSLDSFLQVKSYTGGWQVADYRWLTCFYFSSYCFWKPIRFDPCVSRFYLRATYQQHSPSRFQILSPKDKQWVYPTVGLSDSRFIRQWCPGSERVAGFRRQCWGVFVWAAVRRSPLKVSVSFQFTKGGEQMLHTLIFPRFSGRGPMRALNVFSALPLA